MNKQQLETMHSIKLKDHVRKMFKGGLGLAACKMHPWTVLQMAQDKCLTITDQKLIDVLYRLEPVQTARVFEFASLDADPLEVIINSKLYKAQQVQAAALTEPEFVLAHYDHILDPVTRTICEQLA